MNEEQKAAIRFLIAYYDEHGHDWSIALEYEVRKANGTLPWQEEWPRRRKRKAVEREAEH